MGWVWRHCEECDGGMKMPTVREAVEGMQECPSCHWDNHVPRSDLAMLLDDLDERTRKIALVLKRMGHDIEKVEIHDD